MAIIEITIDEFRGFVYGELAEELDLYFDEITHGGERGFEASIGSGYVYRVLTSIDSDEEVVRKEGSDAIRVQILTPDDDLYYSAPHTKRKPNYREKIKEKSREILDCQECSDGNLRVSESDYGPYFFCTNEDCSNTISIES